MYVLFKVEPIVKPVSSPIKAVVPMDFKHTSPPINDSPALTNPYVNEQPTTNCLYHQ